MNKGAALVLSLLLAGAAGGGSFYQFVYKPSQRETAGRVSSLSEDAVYVDSVRMLAGLGSGTGLIQRYAGVVEPQETWSAKLEGEKSVKKTYVKEGDAVKVGDKLFTYDTTEDEDKLAQDEIELERAQNEIEVSKKRVEQLNQEKAKASADEQLGYTTSILTEENSIKQNEFEIKSKELEIEQLKEGIKNADVTSELEGVVQTVARLTSNNGSSVLADNNSEAYITVMAVGDYRVKGTVNEQNIGEISEGMEMLAFSRVDDQYWPGVVTEVRTDNGESNQSSDSYGFYESGSDSNSSTNYSFYLHLDNSDGLLLGQHVYLEEDEGQGQSRKGIWLPGYYFSPEDDTHARVWAASKENTLEQRQVTLGGYDDALDLWEVTEGLTEEDYITTPNETLTEGLPVNYMDLAAPVVGGEGVYDDAYWDGSLEDDSFFDEGSFAWEDWDEEDWDWEDESDFDWSDDEDWDEEEDWEDEEEDSSEDWSSFVDLTDWLGEEDRL